MLEPVAIRCRFEHNYVYNFTDVTVNLTISAPDLSQTEFKRVTIYGGQIRSPFVTMLKWMRPNITATSPGEYSLSPINAMCSESKPLSIRM
jgi:hypothetical protein